MIAFVKGIIEEIAEDFVIIDNNGIGYMISMPVNDIEKLKKQGESVKVHTYHYVREDSVGLFGFVEKEGLSMFKMLINVSGVGPKAALAILSAISPSNVALSIITGDEKSLCKAQGVGKKLAQRIILELKDKFKDYNLQGEEKTEELHNDDSIEALGALIALGYTKLEAQTALNKVDKSGGVEDIVKQALRALMKQ